MKLTLARKIVCIAALSCAALWSAQAVNLVADPGFEASADNTSGGNPFSASWTDIDPSGFSGVGGNSSFAHTGNNYAFLGADPNFGSLSQNIGGFVAGQSYTLSFWLANDITVVDGIAAGVPNGNLFGNSFRVLFGGVQIFSLTNQGAFGYTQFTISGLVATNTTQTLEFVYQHSNDHWRLDDVSIQAAAVPEAFATMWLALPAFGVLGLVQFSRARTRKSLARI
jgi:hypothetical protein